jgi:hypothetical protein
MCSGKNEGTMKSLDADQVTITPGRFHRSSSRGRGNTMTRKVKNTHRKTAISVGVLFIIATGFLFVGGAVYSPILSSPDYLELAYPNRITVIVGILLEFAIVPAIVLIPVVFFPVLRRHNEVLALGYVAFRLFEAVLLSVAMINKLALINVSQDYLNRGGTDTAYFQYIGSAIQSENYWGYAGGLIYNVVFIIGALILYAALYQSKLVPRLIPVLGFVAAAALLGGSLLATFTDISPATTILLVTPIAAQEMILAVWLIVKGFNSSATVFTAAKTELNADQVSTFDTP